MDVVKQKMARVNIDNLGTNLTKAVINLYSGNCKTVMKKSKVIQMERYTKLMD